mgnify:CR=1 FL=1
MDLTQLYGDPSQYIAGYDDFARGAMKSQEIRNRNFEYKKAQENYEAEKGLKALFARNPNPSMEEIGALSPEFAQAYGKNQFAMQKDLLEMQKNQADIRGKQLEHGEKEQKMLSEAGAPIAHKYLMQYGENMPPEALDAFRREIGNEIAKVEKQHNIKPQEGFDINELTPIDVATRAHKYWPSPVIEQQNRINTERQLSQVPGRPSGPSVQMTPEGYPLQVPGAAPNGPPMGGGYGGGQQPMFRNPSTGTGLAVPPGMSPAPQQPPMQSEPQSNIPAQDIDAFRAYYQSLPPGREKDAARDALAKAARESVPGGGVHEDQGQVTTPAELADIRAKNKVTEVTATEQAKADVARKEEYKRISEAFERAGDPEEIKQLIRDSTSGPVEAKLAAVHGLSGKGTSGMEKIKALSIAAGDLQDAITRMPGAFSDRDATLAALKSADIANENVPYNERLAGFEKFLKKMDKMKSQMEKPSTSNIPKEAIKGRKDAAIDMLMKGEINDAQFHEMWGE